MGKNILKYKNREILVLPLYKFNQDAQMFHNQSFVYLAAGMYCSDLRSAKKYLDMIK